MIPKSTAEILASAKRRPEKRKRKVTIHKPDPFLSDPRFNTFPSTSQDPGISKVSLSTVQSTWLAEAEAQSGTKETIVSRIPLQFEPEITPDTYGDYERNESVNSRKGKEKGQENHSKISRRSRAVAPSNISTLSVDDGVSSRTKRINEVMRILREGRISPFDVFLELLDGTNTDFGSNYRKELYKEGNHILGEILDAIIADPKGKTKLHQWMRPHSLDAVCEEVSDEMDKP